jgi:hypothetical protein
MAQEYLQKYADGMPTIHMKIIKKSDGFLLMRSGVREWGRKFSPGGGGLDYRIFYDESSYDWVSQIEPFGSTATEASIMDGGIWVAMPPVEVRNKLLANTGPRHRKWSRGVLIEEHHIPKARSTPPSGADIGTLQPPSGAGEGHIYLVMVPSERDEQFHTLLRFLHLEALKE